MNKKEQIVAYKGFDLVHAARRQAGGGAGCLRNDDHRRLGERLATERHWARACCESIAATTPGFHRDPSPAERTRMRRFGWAITWVCILLPALMVLVAAARS